jgi:diaminopimelate decarboxylase
MILDDHKKLAAKPYECFIAGNLCFSGDMLSKYKIPLQRKPKYKETLITFDTGGTGQHFVAANPNSFPRTPRILIKTDGTLTIVRKRDTYEDIFCL